MKEFNRSYLPDVVIHNGEIYKLDAELFAAFTLHRHSLQQIEETAKAQGRKVVAVNVLSRRLKGTTDLHGKPYQPVKHFFSTGQESTRYTLTFVNQQGTRILAYTNDGRNLYGSRQEGYASLRDMYKNTSIDTITQVFGKRPRFKVVPVECYPGGDAKQTVFEN